MMNRLRFLWRKQHFSNRFYCSALKFSNLNEAAKYYSPLLDTKETTMYGILAKNDFLMDLEPEEVRRKILYFKYLNVTGKDILQVPTLLTVHLITLENRATILRECGFVESLNLSVLLKYITVVHQRIRALKMNKLIPSDLNMVEQLNKQFEINVIPKVEKDDEIQLQTLREQFLDEFLRKRLDLSDEESRKLWKSYSKIRHKSFGHTQRVVDLLQHEFKMSRDKIIANLYLLHADPENLMRYAEVVPTIGGQSIKEVMLKQPKIMTIPCDRVKQLLDLFRKHEIDETNVLKYSIILTISPSTVAARIEQLRKTKEFEILLKHPGVVKLITYQKKASMRLDFLKKLKVRCASLHILSSHSTNFEKYVRDGCDRTKGKDMEHYLKMIFNQQGVEAINQLKRHSNWFHIPTVQIQESLDYLRSKGFTLNDICKNTPILLYPLTRINSKLDDLIMCKRLDQRHEQFNLKLSSATPEQILALCVYLIELDFHFTGDGIWPEEGHQSDTTAFSSIEFPKTLNKDYKFGKKPVVATTKC